MERVPDDLKNYERPGFVIFTQHECAVILAVILGGFVVVDLARQALHWMFG